LIYIFAILIFIHQKCFRLLTRNPDFDQFIILFRVFRYVLFDEPEVDVKPKQDSEESYPTKLNVQWGRDIQEVSGVLDEFESDEGLAEDNREADPPDLPTDRVLNSLDRVPRLDVVVDLPQAQVDHHEPDEQPYYVKGVLDRQP